MNVVPALERLLLRGRPSGTRPTGAGGRPAILDRPRPVSPGGSDVVLAMAFENWQTLCWREFCFTSDRLFLHLYGSGRARRLMLTDAWQFRPAWTARRLLAAGSRSPFPDDPTVDHVEPLRLRRRDPTASADVMASYRGYDAAVAAAAARAGLEKPVLIATHPFHAAAADPGHWRSVVYVGWDDFAALAARAPWRQAILDAYRTISAAGLPVVGVTRAIVDGIAPTGPALVMPNGIEPAEWTAPAGTPPDWFTALPRPVLLYTGALGIRLDLDVLAALSRAHRSASIVLVGHAAEPEHLASLAALPNVHVRGRHGRAAVRAMTFASDVCLLPHVRTPMTRAMSPLKLFEYLAAGRPVVATDLEPVRGLDERVLLADGPAAFVDQVGAALRLPAVPDADRRAFVAANSWSARFEALLDLAGVGGPAD